MDTSLCFGRASRDFNLRARHTFDVTDNVKVMVSTTVQPGSDQLHPNVNVMYSKALLPQQFPVELTLGTTFDFDNRVAAATVGVRKDATVPVLDNDYASTSLILNGTVTQPLKAGTQPEFNARAGLRSEFYLGDSFLRCGVGVDHSGTMKGAIQADAMTLSTDFKGGWDVALGVQSETGSGDILPGWF
eukprot:Rmarinus@m.7118